MDGDAGHRRAGARGRPPCPCPGPHPGPGAREVARMGLPTSPLAVAMPEHAGLGGRPARRGAGRDPLRRTARTSS